MLGALISILIFGFFCCWIALIKNLRKFKKGEVKMSILEFILFCILTYLLITPLLFIICTLLDDTCLHHVFLNNDSNIVIAMAICLLIVTFFIVLEVKQYRKLIHVKLIKIKKEENSSKSKEENSRELGNNKKEKISKDNRGVLPTESEAFSTTTFIKSFTLIDFTKLYGPKMKVGTFRNGKTHVEYKTCMFTNENGQQTYVGFSSELGDLTSFQITERKDRLMVGQLPTGKFILYDNNWKDWVDVNLNI